MTSATDDTPAEGAQAATRESSARPAEEAFDAFFAAQERRVYGYLWRLTGDRQTAADLAQETFLRAWRHFAEVSGYERPEAWLWRVATNLALNERRRLANRPSEPLASDGARGPAVSDPALAVALRDQVHAALLALPPRMRAALVLRDVYGLSFEEVAEALGVSPSNARVMLSRAREQFRQGYQRMEERP